MLLGAIPPLIVGAAYVTGIVLLVTHIDAVAAWATPFAADWEDGAQVLVRGIAGLVLLAAVAFFAVVTFAGITLTVGDPFYERIAHGVETRTGTAPEAIEETFWAGLWRGIGSGVRFLLLTASVGLLLFALGFIPIVGQTVVPVLGAFFGGWFLALELTGFAFDARGLRLKDRRHMLGVSRATTLGFGVLTYLLFLVPFLAIAVMPAAVAGATMLARDAIAPSTSPARR
jgi:CysZ protein